MSRILSHSVTTWNNYTPVFLTVIYVKTKRDTCDFFVYFLSPCVLIRT